MQIVLLSVFGAAGVLGRYFIDLHLGKTAAGFPLSTLLINCLGSFLMGVVFVLSAQLALVSKEYSVAISIGLLGGFTTFSAFSIQSLQLIEQKQFSMAALYFVGSPMLGLLFAFIGVALAKSLVPLS